MIEEQGDRVEDQSVGDSFARLVESGKDYAQAELDRQKARVSLVGSGVRDAAMLFGLAAMLVFAALVALLVGLIWVLAPVLTPGGATAAVIGGAFLLAILLGLLGRARVRKMMKAMRP